MNRKNKPVPTQALLCLHGAGSSGAIFRFQLARLRLLLRDHFDLIFVDGPNPSIPGPGMLPFFAGAGPFYRWFDLQQGQCDTEVEKIQVCVRRALDSWEATKQPQARIVGILAFSQGVIASTILLWQKQMGRLPWFPKIQFAIFICGDSTEQVTQSLHQDARDHGTSKAIIEIPTLHLHGRSDPFLPQGRKMLTEHFRDDSCQVMEFDGTHQCPNTREDCTAVAAQILKHSATSLVGDVTIKEPTQVAVVEIAVSAA